MSLFLANAGDNRVIMNGVVENIVPGTGTNSDKFLTVNLTGSVWDKKENKLKKETIPVEFWNSQTSWLKNRAMSAKLEAGHQISVLVYHRNNAYYAINFKYNGIWDIYDETGKTKKSIVIGNVKHLTLHDNRITFQVFLRNKDNVFSYVNVSIWASDEELFEAAKRSLEENQKVALICGRNRAYEANNGKSWTWYTAYRFEVL